MIEEFTRKELQTIAKKAELRSRVRYLPYQSPPPVEIRASKRLADAANLLDALIARKELVKELE